MREYRHFTVSLEPKPLQADVDVVREGLYAFNRLHVSDDQHGGLVLFLRAEDGSIHGGLLGETYWGWLHVGILWVLEELRGQGHGTCLLQSGEGEALRRGCHGAYLDTVDFQALPFYLHRGYTIWGTLPDFPPGHTRYWVKKDLAAPEAT